LATSITAAGLEAVAAIYRTAFGGLEGHLGRFATSVTDYVVHRALAASVLTASGATLGIVLESLFGKESLLVRGEHELHAALGAYQCPVLIHDKSSWQIIFPGIVTPSFPNPIILRRKYTEVHILWMNPLYHLFRVCTAFF
jgi:hypothetical protein